MHTNFKYILIDHRDNKIILSGDSRQDLIDKAVEFTLTGSLASYSIYEASMRVSHVRQPVIEEL